LQESGKEKSMSKKRLSQFCGRAIVLGLVAGCAIVFLSLNSAKAQHASLFDDPYYCPASQHSCSGMGGTSPNFAPDPFDVGAGCDSSFLAYTNDPQYDQDGNGIDDRSCYGTCDTELNTTGTVPMECYANCQSGTDGMGGYAGCLRGAFGIGARPQPIGGSGDPRITHNIAGNIYRSCLVGVIPGIYQADYNSCIAAGGTVEGCCSDVASHFP
jgi:hypothetical protein